MEQKNNWYKFGARKCSCLLYKYKYKFLGFLQQHSLLGASDPNPVFVLFHWKYKFVSQVWGEWKSYPTFAEGLSLFWNWILRSSYSRFLLKRARKLGISKIWNYHSPTHHGTNWLTDRGRCQKMASTRSLKVLHSIHGGHRCGAMSSFSSEGSNHSALSGMLTCFGEHSFFDILGNFQLSFQLSFRSLRYWE